MGNSPRQVAIDPVSFTVMFKSRVYFREFDEICEDIGKVRGVSGIKISHMQRVKVMIDESSITDVARIRRQICDMLMGRNCSPHLT